MINRYTEPVSKLLTLGRPTEEDWLDYSAHEIRREHIPELIRLLEDHDLRVMEPPNALPNDVEMPEWYAQVHAWRALGQLKAESAIPAVLSILHQIDDEDDDWLGEDADEVFALIGPVAIQPLAKYLSDETNGVYARVAAAMSLRHIGMTYIETREESVRGLVAALDKYEENDEGLNGFIIYELAQLKDVEHINLIEKAFKADRVDEFIMGDFEDVQIQLGLIDARTKPRPRMSFLDRPPYEDREANLFTPERNAQKTEKKEKNKRKQEKKSRKKNRKRK